MPVTCQYLLAHLSTQLFSPTFKSPSLNLVKTRDSGGDAFLCGRHQQAIEVALHLLSMHFSKQEATILLTPNALPSMAWTTPPVAEHCCRPIIAKECRISSGFQRYLDSIALRPARGAPVEEVDAVHHLLLRGLQPLLDVRGGGHAPGPRCRGRAGAPAPARRHALCGAPLAALLRPAAASAQYIGCTLGGPGLARGEGRGAVGRDRLLG